MPLVEQEITPDRAWGLWKIEETETWLQYEIGETTAIPNSIAHANKRLEYLAARALVKHLIRQMGLTFYGVSKDDFGKPYVLNHSLNLSLSHSYPYVTAIIDRNKAVGIDLEQPKEKLLAVAPRMFQQEELADAGVSIPKHCIYWCAKEALLKVYGKKDLTFARDLIITPFSLQESGLLIGRIIVDKHETRITLYYAVRPDFVIVYTL